MNGVDVPVQKKQATKKPKKTFYAQKINIMIF